LEAVIGRRVIWQWYDGLPYTCARFFALCIVEIASCLLCSTGDADDADSPFSSASNPLFDEQLAAGCASALRSPDDGALCEETAQGGGDVLQLRRCDLTCPQNHVMAAACTLLTVHAQNQICQVHICQRPRVSSSGIMWAFQTVLLLGRPAEGARSVASRQNAMLHSRLRLLVEALNRAAEVPASQKGGQVCVRNHLLGGQGLGAWR